MCDYEDNTEEGLMLIHVGDNYTDTVKIIEKYDRDKWY